MIADRRVREVQTDVGGESAWTGAFDLQVYSDDAAVVDPARPGLVVRLCNDHGLPLTVRRSLPAIPSN